MTTETKATFQFSSLERASREFLDSLLEGEQEAFLTGLKSIDNSLGGLEKGELCIVGGRPSHGKSMFALNWLFNVASSSVNCLLVSEEMSSSALAQRAIAYASDIPREKWRDKYHEVYKQSIEFWESRGRVSLVESVGSVTNAVAAIEQAVEYSRVELCVVDYLQLLHGPGSSKYEQVSYVSSELKRCAVRNNIALVCLAQLGRELEKRDNIPKMRDLKDSGQIEQDADQILFVQWPLRNDPKHKPFDEYRVFCAKNRNRPVKQTVVELRFQPSRQRLVEVPVESRSNYTQAFDGFNNGAMR